MTNYCLGFMFSNKGRQVALIEKSKPAWQAGKFNGIGGHVETGESAKQAMVREFREETGHDSIGADWEQFATMTDPKGEWQVFCFKSFNDRCDLHKTTEETPAWFSLCDIRDGVVPCVPNVTFLVPMAKTKGVTAELVIE